MSSARGGQFEDFKLDFNQLDQHQQAVAILGQAEAKRKVNPTVKVGITYSANHLQTERIRQAYGVSWEVASPPLTHTSGSNQAAVIAEVERLLESEQYKHLKQHFRILPITTMSGDGSPFNETWVNRDLQWIDDFYRQGNVVLGWQNKYTPAGQYAIGGGVAGGIPLAQRISKPQLAHVQAQLNNMKQGKGIALLMEHQGEPVSPPPLSLIDSGAKTEAAVTQYNALRSAVYHYALKIGLLQVQQQEKGGVFSNAKLIELGSDEDYAEKLKHAHLRLTSGDGLLFKRYIIMQMMNQLGITESKSFLEKDNHLSADKKVKCLKDCEAFLKGEGKPQLPPRNIAAVLKYRRHQDGALNHLSAAFWALVDGIFKLSHFLSFGLMKKEASTLGVESRKFLPENLPLFGKRSKNKPISPAETHRAVKKTKS